MNTPPTMLTPGEAVSLIEKLWQIEKLNSHEIVAELAISHAEAMKEIAQVPSAAALLAALQKKAFFHGAAVTLMLYRANEFKIEEGAE